MVAKKHDNGELFGDSVRNLVHKRIVNIGDINDDSYKDSLKEYKSLILDSNVTIQINDIPDGTLRFTNMPVILMINSRGGSLYDGMYLLNMMEANKSSIVHVTVNGSVSMSMGFMFLINGTIGYRYTFDTALAMSHQVQHCIPTTSTDKVLGYLKSTEWFWKKMLDKYLDDIKRKYKPTRSKIKKIKEILYAVDDKEYYPKPEELYDLHFVDHVIPASRFYDEMFKILNRG